MLRTFITKYVISTLRTTVFTFQQRLYTVIDNVTLRCYKFQLEFVRNGNELRSTVLYIGDFKSFTESCFHTAFDLTCVSIKMVHAFSVKAYVICVTWRRTRVAIFRKFWSSKFTNAPASPRLTYQSKHSVNTRPISLSITIL